MGHAGSSPPPLIEWGVAALALVGQSISGDRYLVTPCRHGVLVAVVDGLGHGEEAAAAASSATAMLERYADESVVSLVRRCDERLKRTRGVVMSLASFHAQASTMTWLGVGNVEGVLLRADATTRPVHESVPLRGGVVGYHFPPLRAAVIPVTRGDTLVFATDGIRSSFAKGLNAHDAPQPLADRIFAQYRKGTDDALLLVVRYVGHRL